MLRVRWLGTVPYREALAVQQALFDRGREDHLLLLEHPHVFTYGPRSDLDHHLRCEPAAVGAAAATSPTTGPDSSSATRS
jgi:lipoic acid synthetase